MSKTATLSPHRSRTPDFADTFRQLSALLRPYIQRLVVKADSEQNLYLDCPVEARRGSPHFFGAVATMKSCVAFHFMPVYSHPELLAPLSAELRGRMQGKSCFNFRTVSQEQLEELRTLVERGVALYGELGLIHG